MEENLDVKLALEEMRFNMQQSLSTGEILDQKMNSILGASGLFLAVAATFQIVLLPNRPGLSWLLVTAGVLYVVMVGLALLGASPQTYRLAIDSDWGELNEHLFQKPERDAALSLLSGYVDQIQHNHRINRRKVIIFRISLGILFVVVILFVSLITVR